MASRNPNHKDNLHRPTSEEAREMGRKSGEARRRKKELRQLLPYLLDLPEKNEQAKEALRKMGVESYLMTNRTTILTSLIMQSKKSDVRATRLLFELDGSLNKSKESEISPEETSKAMQDFEVIYSKPTNIEDNEQSAD